MQVSKISYIQNTNKNITKKQNTTQVKISSGNSAIQNVSFGYLDFGLGIKPIDVRKIEKEQIMVPNKKYLIDERTVLKAGNLIIDLNSNEVKYKLLQLPEGEEIIFGRNATRLTGMDNHISSKHFSIMKTKKGELIATDLGSTNGTTILPNIATPNNFNSPFRLNPCFYYALPKNTILRAGNSFIDLSQVEGLKNGNKITIGRDDNVTYKANDELVSRKHLSVEAYRDNLVLVKDLSSTNGTYFERLKPMSNTISIAPYENDYSNILKRTKLQSGVATLIPNDCQIHLGNNFAIDIRNKNIQKALDEKGSITIGRHENCDIIVNNFYSMVSRDHLRLEKFGDKIIAIDSNSRNATEIVPKNEIQAFYNGVFNLEFSQQNIGDCYLLAPLYALSRTTAGPNMIYNMVHVDDKGNYVVKFASEKKPIIIKPEELDGQIIQGTQKRSVCGDLGIRAIERAYAKMENARKSILPNSSQTILAIDKGGYPEDALKKLTNIDCMRVHTKMANIPAMFYQIEQNGIQNNIVMCTTQSKGDYDGYVDPENRFIQKHAYAIKNIDSRHRTVEIVNPHDTRNSNIITWDEFSQYFQFFLHAKI